MTKLTVGMLGREAIKLLVNPTTIDFHPQVELKELWPQEGQQIAESVAFPWSALGSSIREFGEVYLVQTMQRLREKIRERKLLFPWVNPAPGSRITYPATSLLRPNGVESVIEKFGKVQMRVILFHVPEEMLSESPPIEWFQLREYYNAALDGLQKGLCCPVLRFDVLLDPSELAK